LVYTKEGSVSGVFKIEVRNGRVRQVMELAKLGDAEGRTLEARLYRYYGMSGPFDDLEGVLDKKRKPEGARIFLRAEFDAKDGHLIFYVYSNSQTQHRIQVTVKELEHMDPFSQLNH